VNAPDHKHLLVTNPILAGARELNDAEKEAVRAETARYAAGDKAVEAELNKTMGAEK
jgi:hypothetical protein